MVAINKPVGPTSHDVVNQVRRVTSEKRVGHAGTLDPLASGVLVIGIGKATKQLGQSDWHDKEYRATIKLGETSTTDDEEGEKTKIKIDLPPTETEVKRVCSRFMGLIEQVPPDYSAIKINGKAAYAYARAGKAIDLQARSVRIDQLEMVEYRWPFLKIKIKTGPGVYIRSLARDIGRVLKTGGYLTALERTRVGRFTLDQALTIEQLEEKFLKLKKVRDEESGLRP